MTTARPPAELLSFMESLPEPHILLDRDYRILAANDAYRDKWDSRKEIIGRRCFEVSHRYDVPCDEAGESCPLRLALRSGRREQVVHLHHTPQGETLENIELCPVRNGAGDIEFFIERIAPLSVARSSERTRGLIGRSPSFLHMMQLVTRVAPSSTAVLLQGESGTGKELVANAIHQLSPRADRPFVAIDCSGLAETLFESELFGHERGAFTGATSRKAGLVEAASGGTLFLDEVGDIPQTIQVKLLRLLETGTYRRVGSTEIRRADVRIVSATHRSLSAMVDAGSFRADLYYRLNIFPIRVPPLRERLSDVPLLAESLLTRVASGRSLTLTPAALERLKSLTYRGNVRELRNILERASLMCDGDRIDVEHLGESPVEPPTMPASEAGKGNPLRREPLSLADAFAAHRGTLRELAEKLGLSERTLYRRLRELRETSAR